MSTNQGGRAPDSPGHEKDQEDKSGERVPVEIVFDQEAIREFCDKIVPRLSTQPIIDVTGQDAVRPGSTPMTQAAKKPAAGVVR